MQRLTFSILFLATTFLIHSCTKTTGTVEVTYIKATGIYGDLEEQRIQPLVQNPRDIDNPGKIFVSQDLLIIGEENEGVHLIDDTDPSNPIPLSFLHIPGNKEFYVQDGYLYAESFYDMVKIDVRDKHQPQLVSRVRNAFANEFVNEEGESLIGFDFREVTEKFSLDEFDYFNFEPYETYYFDFKNSLIPTSAVPSSFAGNSGSAIGSVNRIAYYKNHVYVISRLNISIFEDVSEFEKISTHSLGWEMETIFPYNDHLFIGTRASMDIFNITNLTEPSWVSNFWHANSCDPVYPIDGFAYVTLRTGDFSNCPGDVNALVVLDINDLSNPLTLEEKEMESPYGMTLIGDRLYVGEGDNGLKIFDASDRGELKLEHWDKTVDAYDVIPHPVKKDVLLIAGPEGLGQYELENSNQLKLVSWLSM